LFQAFFTSYLVESGYEEGFNTIDDLVKSNLFYGFNSAIEFLFMQFDFSDTRLYSMPRIACPDLLKCAERVVFEGDMFTIFSRGCAYYIATKSGVDKKSRLICFVAEHSFSGYIGAYLPKGSMFLDRINSVLSHYLEGGLLSKYWSHLTWGEILKSKQKLGNINSQDFIPFSVSHLIPAFKVILFGHILSFIVFLVELSVGRLRAQ
jgi:hypothetical protein